MKSAICLLTFAFLLSTVHSLTLTVQPQTLVGVPSLVLWTRDDSDNPPLEFDLRFVQDDADVGLAQANIEMGADDQFGEVMITFPNQGQYVLKAVTGPRNILIGMSDTITAIASVGATSLVPSGSTTSGVSSTSTSATSSQTSASPSTTTSSPSSSITSSSTSVTPHPTSSASASATPVVPRPVSLAKQPANVTAIVAGVLATFLLIALLIALFLFLRHRKRVRENDILHQRISFHQDLMVQRRDGDKGLPSIPVMGFDDALVIPKFDDGDVEQGVPPSPPTEPSAKKLTITEYMFGLGSGPEPSPEPAPSPEPTPIPVPHTPVTGLLHAPSARLGTGHIVPSPRGPRPSLKIKKTEGGFLTVRPPSSPVVPPLRSAPVFSTSQHHTVNPDSAAAAAAVTTRSAKRTKRQRQLTDRISMLSKQMADIKVSFDDETDENRRSEHKHVLEEMQRQMVWLRDQEEGAWALGLTDVSPPGWARYMTP